MQPDTVKVDNPFTMEKRERSDAVALFREWLTSPTWTADCQQKYPPLLTQHLCSRRAVLLAALPKLRGKNLACWCPLPPDGGEDVCHGAMLIELAHRPTP